MITITNRMPLARYFTLLGMTREEWETLTLKIIYVLVKLECFVLYLTNG